MTSPGAHPPFHLCTDPLKVSFFHFQHLKIMKQPRFKKKKDHLKFIYCQVATESLEKCTTSFALKKLSRIEKENVLATVSQIKISALRQCPYESRRSRMQGCDKDTFESIT